MSKRGNVSSIHDAKSGRKDDGIPYSLRSEKACLGALMSRNPTLEKLPRELAAEHFYFEEHRLIFEAIQTLSQREGDEKAFDAVTVAEWLQDKGDLEKAGKLEYIAELPKSIITPEPDNVRIYALTILEKAAARKEIEKLRTRIEDLYQGKEKLTIDSQGPPSFEELAISEKEMESARLHPTCIVDKLLYADLAELVAPGGTGKTTHLLYEAACIALGLPVWGLEVRKPGWTLLISGEDRRERLVARLREICWAHGFTKEQTATARRDVRIWDATGQDLKLVRMINGSIELTSIADRIIQAYKDDPPVQVIIDPRASFQASEAAINDNEQQLVLAGRRVIRELDCCFRYVHHSGQASYLNGSLHQYAGRGGTAMSDGCRMVGVIQAWEGKDIDKHPMPPSLVPESGSSITVYARPKLSYAPKGLPYIWIKRTDFLFKHYLEVDIDSGQEAKLHQDKILDYLVKELEENDHLYSKNDLDNVRKELGGITRDNLRHAIHMLMEDNRVVQAPLPKERRQGGRKHFLCPAYLSAKYREVE